MWRRRRGARRRRCRGRSRRMEGRHVPEPERRGGVGQNPGKRRKRKRRLRSLQPRFKLARDARRRVGPRRQRALHATPPARSPTGRFRWTLIALRRSRRSATSRARRSRRTSNEGDRGDAGGIRRRGRRRGVPPSDAAFEAALRRAERAASAAETMASAAKNSSFNSSSTSPSSRDEVVPDGMRATYAAALGWGRAAAAAELVGDKREAASTYARAHVLLSFLLSEGPGFCRDEEEAFSSKHVSETCHEPESAIPESRDVDDGGSRSASAWRSAERETASRASPTPSRRGARRASSARRFFVVTADGPSFVGEGP